MCLWSLTKNTCHFHVASASIAATDPQTIDMLRRPAGIVPLLQAHLARQSGKKHVGNKNNIRNARCDEMCILYIRIFG